MGGLRSALIPLVCLAISLAAGHPGAARAADFRADPGAELIWRLPLEQKLEKSISFSFQDMPITDVVDFFRTQLQINLVLDQSVIAEDERLITFTANDMRAGDALKWIMTLSGLDYGFRTGAIYISTRTRARAAEARYLNIYNVKDLTQNRSGGAQDGDDDDDDNGDDGSGGGTGWLVRVIVELTGRENWRHVTVLGAGDDEDETTNGADAF